jgi:transcriptional regulator with XRE-family HTH domain
MKTMGTRLKELRMNAGYTGEEVGRMLQVSKSAISMWEKDLRSPSADLIERFAEIYGVSTDYIITGRESNAPKGYYHDQEAAEYAEYLRTRPHAKILFSASKDMTKEDMEEAVRYIEYLKSKHK